MSAVQESAVQQWEAFQRGATPSRVPRQILDSWKRSRWNGIATDTLPIPWREVADRLPLLETAEPILRHATDSLPTSQTALSLSDEHGHVIWRWTSEPDFARLLDTDGHMQFGSVFDEDAVGTNGIGTALRTGTTAVVVGAQHFVRAYHQWACAAAPVRHPRTGRVVGTVNVSTIAEYANGFLRIAVDGLARQIEQALELELSATERTLHEAFRSRAAGTAATLVAVNAKTLITDADAARLSLDHRMLWRRVRALDGGSRVDLGEGLAARVWQVDATEVAAGAVLELERTAVPTAQHATATTPTTPTTDAPDASSDPARRTLTPIERAEFDAITDALARCDGRRAAAARHLGISRSTLYEKLRRYQLG